MSLRPDPVRISDLRQPIFPNFVKELLESAKSSPLKLSVESVQTAVSQTDGLQPYSDPAYLERMQLLLDCMNEDDDLSAFGRANNFGIMVRYATQRARLEKLYAENPEINNIVIDRPIIIAGLPRSGTTHLLNLISVDPRLRSLPYWESIEPFQDGAVPVAAFDPNDSRIIQCREQLSIQDSIMPLFKNMHDMSPEHTHEEVELMGMDFSMMLFENYAIMPKWRDYYLTHNQTGHYEFLKRALKALQWIRGPERWILKSPQHLEQMPALKAVFPDASYVVTHRDPVSVTSSLLTMLSYSARLSRDPVQPSDIALYWVDRVEKMLRACIAGTGCLPHEQTKQVLFHEFMADDVGTVDAIYTQAGHPMTNDIRNAMHQYMVDNPRGKYGQVQYDLREDFGLDTAALYEQFKFYTDHFGIKIEHKN
ncbi:MAG: sulfotransferase [Pseudomonadales bacterium]